jgi:uncharacterized protein
MKKEKIKITADTNIYISALHTQGNAQELLILGQNNKVDIYISKPILEEIKDVLKRKLKWERSRIEDALLYITKIVQKVPAKEKIKAVKADPDDDRILECAVASKSHFIISGDKHLTSMKTFRDIIILSPRSFFDKYVYEEKQ